MSLNADGNRLYAGHFDESGLNCNNWWNDDNGNDNVGFFLLMV